MDVAGQHAVRIVKDGLRLVGKDDLRLGAHLADQVAVVLHVVHACELMLVHAEQLAVFFQRKHVGIGVHARRVDLVEGYQLVAHLVGGVAEHQHDLLRALGDAAQADGEAVAGQDGEDHADGLSAQLGFYVRRHVVHGGVVALRPRHDGFRHGDDVAVAQLKALAFRRFQHAFRHDLRDVVSLADDGAADAA